MSLKRSLILNTGFNLAGYIYLLVASFFTISILLNNLGRDLLGVYFFLGSFITLAAVFDFGISNAVIRKLSLPQTTKEEKVRTWKTSFGLFISIALVLVAVIASILAILSRTLPLFNIIDQTTINWSILIIAFIVFVNHLNSHLLILPQAQQRFDIFNSKTFLVGTANTVITAIVSSFYPNIAAIFAVQLIFHILTFIFMILYDYKTFPGSEFMPGFDPAIVKELLSFGIKNFVGTLAGQIEAQFSNYVLGIFATAKAITSFSIPQSIVAKGAGVVSQFAQVFYPMSASLLVKDRIKKLKLLVFGLEGFVLAGGVLAIFLSYTIGEAFLTWWLKDQVVVQAAVPILKILSFYFLLVALTPIPTSLVQGLNKPQIPSLFAVLTVTLEISSSIYFVPHFQALGVAYSFLFSSLISVPAFLITSWILFQKEIHRVESEV